MDPLSFEALLKSVDRCQKGVIWKDSVASFSLDRLEKTLTLKSLIEAGEYVPREPNHFMLTRPKAREAASICFRDRVYQSSLNDNVLYPALTKSFIYDNGACQKGKGTDFSRDRLKAHLQKAYRKWGTNFYALQCDIKGYYPNMDHQVVEEYFLGHLPSPYAEMAIRSLRAQYPGGKGYQPGSQMLQLAGIAMLNPLDHFIKERLGIKHYLRYMDDFILLHPSVEYLRSCEAQISEFLVKYKMTLHPTKTKIYSITDGVFFLGFVHHLTDTGKVYRLIDPLTVKREIKHLKHLKSQVKSGKIPAWKYTECLKSWEAYAKKGNTHKIILRLSRL